MVYGYITAHSKPYRLLKGERDEMKKNSTEAEALLWKYLRNKSTGHKIRRQHIIDRFVADFVCLNKKVIIEVDGKVHDDQKESDTVRIEKLNQLGYQVIRFMNEEVLCDPELVYQMVKKCLDTTSFSPPLEG